MTRFAIGILVMIALLLPNPLMPRAKASDVFAVTELLKNRSFERDSDGNGIPDDWRPHNLGPEDRLVADPFDGVYAFKIVGEAGINKGLRQIINLAIPSGTRFEFRAYSKAENAARWGVGGLYEIKVILYFADNTTRRLFSPFRRGSHDWEVAGGSDTFFKDITKVLVSVTYNDQTGAAWFDLTHFGVGEP